MLYNGFGGKLIFQSQTNAGLFFNNQETKALMQLLGSTATVESLRTYLGQESRGAQDATRAVVWPTKYGRPSMFLAAWRLPVPSIQRRHRIFIYTHHATTPLNIYQVQTAMRLGAGRCGATRCITMPVQHEEVLGARREKAAAEVLGGLVWVRA
ncbi:hypothetical protein PLESTM_001062500, partial [Pleodorina starrii]